MSSARPRQGAPLVALLGAAGVVLVLLVGLWAATAGPDDAFRSDGPDPDRITTSSPTEPPSTSASAPPEADDDGALDDSDAGWLGVVLGGVIFLAAALVVLAALALAQGGLRRLREPARRDRRPDDDDETGDLTVVEAITEDAAAQEEILAAGGTTPRNAIVECWHRFEAQADRAGIPREPWETSSEFTLRLLDLAGADGRAVARLAELYREARFSEHEVGEEHRAAALEALRRIHPAPGTAARPRGAVEDP
ncbi:DUF4129 domain-containing protein [Nocardioides dongxiaopingii]|uniref:DUF4129 domain-containing protein n=1 Tax=Nocardioides sp. S-1144 TaxID=2582905 RepID=UPI00110D4538|nr:DUF4129 domain-containing protein [Nocardioides sp. S-1144]QCW50304.1 DUF4129 domain-containing protein [Nocardioides sp. S-1144]